MTAGVVVVVIPDIGAHVFRNASDNVGSHIAGFCPFLFNYLFNNTILTLYCRLDQAAKEPFFDLCLVKIPSDHNDPI